LLPELRPDVALVAPYPKIGVRHGGMSGVASYTANLAHTLAGAGARVVVIAPAEPGEPLECHDGPVHVRRPFQRGVRAVPAGLSAARRTGAAVVHLQHELFLYGGPAALPGLLPALTPAVVDRWARAVGRPRRNLTVVTMHQVVDPATVDRGYARMHRIGVPASVARVGIEAVQDVIRRLADVVVVHEPSFAKVVPGAVTIPHGVEVVERSDRRAARAGLDVDGRFVALCFGFLAPYKGLELACSAAEIAGPRVQLVVAGGPHPRVEQRSGYAEALRSRYGGTVRFTGYVDEPDVARWFAAADIAVLPYPAPHASSGALALAIAHRTPVLASAALARTCGLPDAMAFGSDAQALAVRLGELADDPAARASLVAAVDQLAAGRTWPTVARQHLSVYATNT
jgi:glycosyltransferase involved in cell wall biosynthesis